MWLTRTAAVCGVLISSVAGAQERTATPAPIAERLNTDQVRVIVATLSPNTRFTSPAGHDSNRVVIHLDAGVMTDEAAGNTTRVEFQRGDVRWLPSNAGATSENISAHPIRILEVALKGSPGPPRTTTLDPVALDRAHFKVLLDNEHVRVLRVHYGPHESSPNHEHLWNRVILYLNDQTDVKADEVRIGAPRIHIEENASDQPLDAIAIELK